MPGNCAFIQEALYPAQGSGAYPRKPRPSQGHIHMEERGVRKETSVCKISGHHEPPEQLQYALASVTQTMKSFTLRRKVESKPDRGVAYLSSVCCSGEQGTRQM